MQRHHLDLSFGGKDDHDDLTDDDRAFLDKWANVQPEHYCGDCRERLDHVGDYLEHTCDNLD